MSFQDFEGEFGSVKEYSLQELQSDKLIKRLRLERRLNEEMSPTIAKSKPSPVTSAKPASENTKKAKLDLHDRIVDAPSANYTFQAQKKPKIMLVGMDSLKQSILKPRRRITLAGTNELQDKLERKKTKNEMKSQEDLKTAENAKRKKPFIHLIPMAPETQEESQDNFVDATQNFHDEELAEEIITSRMDTNDNEATNKLEFTQEDTNGDYYDASGDGQVDIGTNSRADDIQNSVSEEDMYSNGVSNDGAATDELSEKPTTPLDFTACTEDIKLMRKTIMSQLLGKTFPLFDNSTLAGPYNEVYSLFEHTIKDHEGHSTLVVGPRGAGKSVVIDRALQKLQDTYNDQFIIIKLNALLHSDDKIALREIARQLDTSSRKLGGENTDTRTFEQRAISDTFSNILLTLDSNAPGRNYDETQELPIPIIFVIDEIEKFTSSNKQTLLYNLFDLSQSSKIPICVVGVSTKITTRELLEKRVMSRFSQRIITMKRASGMNEFWDNAQLALTVPPSAISSFTNSEYPVQWNEYIQEQFRYGSGLKKVMYKIYHTTKSYQDFNHSCMLPVSKITAISPFPLLDEFEKYLAKQSPNMAQSIIAALSTLELLLVIAAARWIEKVDVPQVNFNLAYKEYKDMMELFNTEATTLSSSTSYIDSTVLAGFKVSQKIWSQKVMRDSWANLYRMGILFDVITSNNEVNVNNDSNMYKSIVLEDAKMSQLDITLEELGQLIDGLNSIRKLTKL